MRREPLTYYQPRRTDRRRHEGLGGPPQRRRVGLVGLGAGTLAAYSEPGERWTFFEIDPVVVDVARDRGLFTYLGRRARRGGRRARRRAAVAGRRPRRDVRAAGARRLQLGRRPGPSAHARGARALRCESWRPGGLLAFHLSNRVPVARADRGGRRDARRGWSALSRSGGVTAAEADGGSPPPAWVVLAREARRPAAARRRSPRWRPLPRAGTGLERRRLQPLVGVRSWPTPSDAERLLGDADGRAAERRCRRGR